MASLTNILVTDENGKTHEIDPRRVAAFDRASGETLTRLVLDGQGQYRNEQIERVRQEMELRDSRERDDNGRRYEL